jgi:antibiotic biosynthesis monooxygenase (ABM) superfamily enzyme
MEINWTAVLQTLIVAGVPAVAGLVEKWLKRRSRKKAKQLDQ